jgi:hypothetical protein
MRRARAIIVAKGRVSINFAIVVSFDAKETTVTAKVVNRQSLAII